MVEVTGSNIGRAYTGRLYDTGKPLDLWGGLLGWRKMRFQNDRTLFTTQCMLTHFL